MQELFLLVILTMAEASGTSAAFVGTETRSECEARGEAIRPILDKAKVDVQEFVCVPSAERFQRFEHGVSADAQRFFYRLVLTADGVNITRAQSLDSCRAAIQAAPAEPAGARVYCASSSQEMLQVEEKR